MTQQAYIQLKGICKRFGMVVANEGVNLSVNRGEIHAILGENGSGKSTLMNILSGIYTQDAGEIYVGEKKARITSPKESQNLGIGMIHQHFKLVEVLTAKENIVGGTRGPVLLHGKKLDREITELGQRYGLAVQPGQLVYRMSISEKQTVEILKALYRGSDVLILDEPTAVLTPQETKQLFVILKNMREKGCSILFITHKLGEVMEVSDRVTVLRKGKSIATVNTADTNPMQLTEMMVGSAIDLGLARTPLKADQQEVVSVTELSAAGIRGEKPLRGVSFSVRSHEILGVAGVAGSGQKELCEALAGMIKPCAGRVVVKGRDITGLSPREIMARGVSIGFVPEDRLGMGLMGGMDIVDNVMLKSYYKSPGVWMDRKQGQQQAQSIVKRYAVSTPGTAQMVRRLSGGNIQKILLGREIDLNPDFLIVAYPVRGLDIGASLFIYSKLNEQKAQGVAVLFVGEDLDVLLGVCDRIAVMHAGRLMGIVDAQSATKEEIGLLMMGHKEGDSIA